MGRFLNGLLLGVGVGLLIAPEKGEDIRANLADASNRWRDQLNRLLGRGGARLDDLRNFIDSEIDGMNDDARGKISKILDELGPDEREQGGQGGRSGAAEGGRQNTASATQGQREPASRRQGQQQSQPELASATQQGQRQEARSGQQQEGQQEGRQQQGNEGRKS